MGHISKSSKEVATLFWHLFDLFCDKQSGSWVAVLSLYSTFLWVSNSVMIY